VQALVENVRTQALVIKKYGYDNLECILSEAYPDGWAAGGRFDNANLNFRNTEYYASYVASGYKNIADLAGELQMDIRPLAWAFMFEGERCFEGTRAFSTQGVDKPVLNLFKLLARLGGTRVRLESSRDLDPCAFSDPWGTGEGPEANGWATLSGDGRLCALVYCHHDDWDVKQTFDTALRLERLPMEGRVRVRHYRVDETHSNAYAEWARQGRPDWPEGLQYEAIRAAGGRIKNVHFADSYRGLPGEGNIDFASVVRALVESGYTGAFALETLCIPTCEHILEHYASAIKSVAGMDIN
jgi:xylan 1,4-beta-xylosidase